SLGAIRNDSLIYEMGLEIARQCKIMGIQVNLAPVADVNVNPANPIIGVRSFGEDPSNVARKASAYVRGLREGGVMAVGK
ncbi:glycoside hydrolase family 3 N-terminal domain-containing protein, partial [Klebsiella pneumoniae]